MNPKGEGPLLDGRTEFSHNSVHSHTGTGIGDKSQLKKCDRSLTTVKFGSVITSVDESSTNALKE